MTEQRTLQPFSRTAPSITFALRAVRVFQTPEPFGLALAGAGICQVCLMVRGAAAAAATGRLVVAQRLLRPEGMVEGRDPVALPRRAPLHWLRVVLQRWWQ